MILLVAAERGGGGDGQPVFITVPWSPSISARGQLPGSVYRSMMRLHGCVNLYGGWVAFRGLSDTELFMLTLAIDGYSFTGAMGVVIARHLLVELGVVDGPGPRT